MLLTQIAELRVVHCSEPAKLDRFWLEFSAAIPRLGGAESDEGIEVFGRPEDPGCVKTDCFM